MMTTLPKVIIAAGGKGTRIQSVDSKAPKPLIEINGKPILLYEIESLAGQGFTDIVLTVSHMAEMIQSYFGDGSSYNCNISYYKEEIPLGNAGALYKLWESKVLGADEDFFFLIADAMFDVNFHRFLKFHRSHNAIASLFTHPNSHPYDSSVLVTDADHRITEWLTKEDSRPTYYKNCVNAGLHILNTELLRLSHIPPSTVGSGESQRKVDLDRDVLKPAISTGRIYSYTSPEYVKDMGTPERFEQVTRDLTFGFVNARNLSRPQKAIFLDRDGTINRYNGFVRDPQSFALLPGVSEAIKLINVSGYLAIIITNQPVIARGEVTEEQLNIIHNKLETLLGIKGAYIDSIYYCPHHPDKGFPGEVKELKIDCNCRKPKPGMILQACEDFNIEVGQSWMIGDGWRDVACGQAAGTHTVLLRSPDSGGAGATEPQDDSHTDICKYAEMTEPDLLTAVKRILSHVIPETMIR